ncbi:minor capsid protein [Alteribacillus sp. JSM 102045]|uniref:phage tail terminator protein n=1 Tax=Alteribacillus sp. JSM 102045 TaxID=1562101 RepID=UPI0035BF3429
MDFLAQMKSYIEDSVQLYKTPLSVSMLKDGNDIAIRTAPGSAADRYVSGQKTHSFQFQILTRHETDKTAYDALQDITNEIDGLTNGTITSCNGSFIFNQCEVYTLPNFVEETDHGESIYTAMFRAEIYL